MKKMTYETPSVEVIEVNVEKGFALSSTIEGETIIPSDDPFPA